jgi:hypothetical protein
LPSRTMNTAAAKDPMPPPTRLAFDVVSILLSNLREQLRGQIRSLRTMDLLPGALAARDRMRSGDLARSFN